MSVSKNEPLVIENVIVGTPQADVIEGTDEQEVILGRRGNDEIFAKDGEDFIFAGPGDDSVSAGNGNDNARGGRGDDTLVGNKGDDTVLGGRGDDLLIWNNGDGSDLLNGGKDTDKVQVNFDTDLVNDDLQNKDVAEFGVGDKGIEFARIEVNDQTEVGLFQLDIRNTEALETNFGGGDDRANIVGNVLQEIALDLDGGDGVDLLDFSEAAEGVDVSLKDGTADSAVINDFENVIGTEFDDKIEGDRKDNHISGLGGTDYIEGKGGDDTLVGNKGDDSVFGGAGNDLLIWNNGDGSDLLNGGGDEDRVQVNFNTDLVNDNLENDDVARIEAGGPGVSFARIEVNGQSEVGLFELDIRRTETLEVNGGAGEDRVELADEVISETVDFRIPGEGGPTNASFDVEIVNALLDEIALDLDGGEDEADTREATSAEDIDVGDTIDVSDFARGVRIDLDVKNQGVLQGPSDGSDATREGLSEEGGLFVGASAIDALDDFENVIGTEFNDAIFGNTQNNVLMGGGGDDVLHPFGGDDFVDGGEGTDTLLLNGFAKGSFVDMEAGVAQFVDGTGGTNTFVNIENINGSSVAADVIFGDAEDNVLNGLGGNDTLLGGEGDDELIGGDNIDRARAAAEGNNEDVLEGGVGADRLTGGLGADSFLYAEGEGGDTITDFTIEDDQFVLDAESFG
ncbi:MAG: calcium-binding protein, partial [Pseudomonadota bacterium]